MREIILGDDYDSDGIVQNAATEVKNPQSFLLLPNPLFQYTPNIQH
jgi:hypothetical protein